MYIKIQKSRFPVASIKEVTECGSNKTTGKWVLKIKISRTERLFCFDNMQEYEKVLAYLDTVLKVQIPQ
jgi:hypothetical protein